MLNADCQGKTDLIRWEYNWQGCQEGSGDMKLAGSPFQHSLEGRGCFARWMLETIGGEAKGKGR